MDIPKQFDISILLAEISELDLFNLPDGEFDKKYNSGSVLNVLGELLYKDLLKYGFNKQITNSFSNFLDVRTKYMGDKFDPISKANSEYTEFLLLIRSGGWSYGNLYDTNFDETESDELERIKQKLLEFGFNLDIYNEKTQTAILNSIYILLKIFDDNSNNNEIKFLLFAKHVLTSIRNLYWSNYIFMKESQRIKLDLKRRFELIKELVLDLNLNPVAIDLNLLIALNSTHLLPEVEASYGELTIHDMQFGVEQIEKLSEFIKSVLLESTLLNLKESQVNSVATYLAYRFAIFEQVNFKRKLKPEEIKYILSEFISLKDKFEFFR